MTSLTKPRSILYALVVSVVFGLIVGLAGAVAHGHARSAPRRHAEVSKRLLRYFSVFRRRHTVGRISSSAAGVSPSDLVSQIRDRSPFVAGMQASSVQEVSADGKLVVWLIPGPTGVCIVTADDQNGSLGQCNSTARAEAGALIGLLQVADGSQTLFGLVPNGNPTITVATPSGSRSVGVTNNVFAVNSSSGFTSFTMRTAAGTVSTRATPSRTG